MKLIQAGHEESELRRANGSFSSDGISSGEDEEDFEVGEDLGADEHLEHEEDIEDQEDVEDANDDDDEEEKKEQVESDATNKVAEEQRNDHVAVDNMVIKETAPCHGIDHAHADAQVDVSDTPASTHRAVDYSFSAPLTSALPFSFSAGGNGTSVGESSRSVVEEVVVSDRTSKPTVAKSAAIDCNFAVSTKSIAQQDGGMLHFEGTPKSLAPLNVAAPALVAANEAPETFSGSSEVEASHDTEHVQEGDETLGDANDAQEEGNTKQEVAIHDCASNVTAAQSLVMGSTQPNFIGWMYYALPNGGMVPFGVTDVRDVGKVVAASTTPSGFDPTVTPSQMPKQPAAVDQQDTQSNSTAATRPGHTNKQSKKKGGKQKIVENWNKGRK